MQPMDTNEYLAKIGSINDSFNDQMRELANNVLESLIIPKCEEHGLKFSGGHGGIFFADGQPKSFFIESHSKESIAKYGLEAIFAILMVEVANNHYFGCWVRDYHEADFRKDTA